MRLNKTKLLVTVETVESYLNLEFLVSKCHLQNVYMFILRKISVLISVDLNVIKNFTRKNSGTRICSNININII